MGNIGSEFTIEKNVMHAVTTVVYIQTYAATRETDVVGQFMIYIFC
jgi:hypothetical protein